eukprot:1591927-Amphidinium_carterae.1
MRLPPKISSGSKIHDHDQARAQEPTPEIHQTTVAHRPPPSWRQTIVLDLHDYEVPTRRGPVHRCPGFHCSGGH